MAEDANKSQSQGGTATPPAKTRRQGVNKVDANIESPKDAQKFLDAFREKVSGEDSKATRTYNNDGFTSLGYEDIEAVGLLKIITCAADALGKKDASLMQIAAQITASTSRRQIEATVTADYTAIAKRAKFTDLDAFARKQTNGATNKTFKDFAELIHVAVESEMNGEPTEKPAGAAA